MRPVLVAAGAGVLLAATLAAIALVAGRPGATGEAGARERYRGNEAAPGLTLPAFALRDQNGRLLRSQDLRGKVVVLTFLDTRCTEACPIIAGQIGRAWGLLTPGERSRVAAVAISTHPRDDTPAAVAAFLERHRAGQAIRYLAGPVSVLRPLWKRFQILSSLESGSADVHSAPVRIYGADMTWLATQHAGADLSPRNLAHDVRVALGSRSS